MQAFGVRCGWCPREATESPGTTCGARRFGAISFFQTYNKILMAKLQDILTVEQDRPDSQSARVVHLFLEGSFLRAYEWSAWLCCRYLNEFKATRRRIKNTEQDFVFIGFPETSLEKYNANGIEIIQVADKAVDMVLPESLVVHELDVQDFSNWKQSVPLAESKRKDQILSLSQGGLSQVQSPSTLTSVMHTILEFPLERKTPFDCMVFVADLKQQITRMI